MIVRAGCELWIWQADDGTLTLELPAVTANGVGAPGAMESPPAHIIRPGQTIGLIMAMPSARPMARIRIPLDTGEVVDMDPKCQACVNIAFGRPPADGISHVHSHPPQRRPQ